MSARLITILSSVLLTLGGCAHLVGPDYEPPATVLPDRWTVSSGASGSVPPGWWTLFADPELSRLEALAVEANQDLVAAMHRVDAARADFRVTRADLLPSLNAGASTDRTQGSANFTQLPGFTPPEVTQYRLTSGLSY